MKAQPYNNPTCELHHQPYLWNGEWWECGEDKHPKPKFYCLVRNYWEGHGIAEWDYSWEEEDETREKEVVIKVSEIIYKQILTEKENV